jgi:hypothetical protein
MKYASIDLDCDKLIGKMLRAVTRGETLKLRVDLNEKEGNEQRPDYKSHDGISIWIKEN